MGENVRNIDFYGYNETILDPIALCFILLMVTLVILLPRRNAILPFIATALYITHLQRIVIAGLDFDMMRILIIVGIFRILLKSEHKMLQFNTLDKTILLFAATMTIMHTLQIKSSSAFIEKIGYSLDALGSYFMTRCLIRNLEDVKIIVKWFAILIIPVTIAMVIEQYTGRNYFSVFGGVNEYTIIRDGRLRSQAAFSHPILAGTVGAFLLPLFVGFFKKFNMKLLMLTGIVCATIITITSSSSGPILAYMAGIFAMMIWPLRKHLRYIRWGTIWVLVGLHIIMKDPVWGLIARVGVFGSSTGYHRYRLIDITIKSFKAWWLYGTGNTGSWGWGLQDITNQFIKIAFDGGIFTLIIFTFMIWITFKNVGVILNSNYYSDSQKWCSWCWGASQFVHIVSFMSVSYFGQMVPIWYMSLGILSNLPQNMLVEGTNV